ncbi:SPFH domain-containing protein [Streptomyces sp. enrichment culture]|uniref:SPFH domain-containing protein n=1 Tax=Streptomyces sp. enrichment culture TaxID=1795815 RepID=UPI003F57AE63
MAVAQTRLHIGPAARVAVLPAPVRSRWVAGVPGAVVLTAREVLLPHGRTAGDDTALGDVPAARTEPGHAPAAPADGNGTAPGGGGAAAPEAPATATLDIPHPAAAPDPQATPPAATEQDPRPGQHGASQGRASATAAEPAPVPGRPQPADAPDAPGRHATADAAVVPGTGDGSHGAPGAHPADAADQPGRAAASAGKPGSLSGPLDAQGAHAADTAGASRPDGQSSVPTRYAAAGAADQPDIADGPHRVPDLHVVNPADAPGPYAQADPSGRPGRYAATDDAAESGTTDGVSTPHASADSAGGPAPQAAASPGDPGRYATAGAAGRSGPRHRPHGVPAAHAVDPAETSAPCAQPDPYAHADTAGEPGPSAAAEAAGAPRIPGGTLGAYAVHGSGAPDPYAPADADGLPGMADTPAGVPGPYAADSAGRPGAYAAADPVGSGSASGSPDEPVGVPGPGVAGDAATGDADVEGEEHAVPAGRGSVVEIVSLAVARGVEGGGGEAAQGGVSSAAVRGVDVTAVPVHLPFPAEPRTPGAGTPAAAPGRSARRAVPVPRPAPGRRVPRGDDRLREHRGPVLPGWVGVAVGGLALGGCLAVLWRAGAVPDEFTAAFGVAPRAYQGLRATHWPPLAFLGIVALLSLGGLGRGKVGHAWVLTLFGRYRGTVRRTGLTWVSPLLLRRRIDVRLRHWRSDPMPAVDCGGLALQVVVQVVWQVKDTARAALAVEDHTEYLAEQVEAAMARVLSQLPADAFHEDAPTLRDTEAVGEALTRMLAAETEAVGIEVYSAQPTRIEYAPEVAEAMRRRRVAAIDAKHRDTVLTSVVDAVDDTVHRLTSRGLVELDDYERKALVKDLTVAFYTGRSE